MMRVKTVNPGTVYLLPDGRWSFTMVVDGKEMQAITPASVTAHEAKQRMRALVETKREQIWQEAQNNG